MQHSPEIIIREKAAPTPTFAGMPLPTALREMRANNVERNTPNLSSASALAKKFKNIQLDKSPELSDNEHQDRSPLIRPTKLQFPTDSASHNSTVFTNKAGGHRRPSKATTSSPSSADYEKENRNSSPIQSTPRARQQNDTSSVRREAQIASTTNSFVSSAKTHGRQEKQNASAAKMSRPKSKDISNSESAQGNSLLTNNISSIPNDPLPGESSFDAAAFHIELDKVLRGKDSLPWPYRKEALVSLSKEIKLFPGKANEVLKQSATEFAMRVNDQLEELRPTVITSALELIDSVILCNLGMANEFANQVFPSVMDVVCGRSLTAKSASKTLVRMLDFNKDLAKHLQDADNPEQLLQLVIALAESGEENIEAKARNVVSLVKKEIPQTSSTPIRPLSLPVGQSPRSASQNIRSPAYHDVISTSSRKRSPPINKLPVSSISARSSSSKILTNSAFRNPGDESGETSSLQTSLNRSRACSLQPLPSRSPAIRNGAQILKNMKLGDSARKVSPNSGLNSSPYSEEELDGIRKSAMKMAMESITASRARDRQKLYRENEELRRKNKMERSEIRELRSVLQEYELTMQKMVSQGNSQANAKQMELETESNRLKAELLELSESFEKLKERYASAKETIALYENKENRFIEQIKDLKRNMVELQKWSNDLKANSEKKLSKAFESVTAYRSSYLDKEAHANKAMSDLKRTAAELEKAQETIGETARKVAAGEAELHKEQDTRASAEAALSTAKSSLSSATGHRYKLQAQLSSATGELCSARAKLSDLEQSKSHFSDVEKKLEVYTSERQSLKARAYDDMTRIQELEKQVNSKNAEVDELNQICEEIMAQLEKEKLSNSSH